ncbi:hypothetical protein NLG97_g3417 [Lecanicillium saksenae]|uniref:Uncharacterized protein n=1 Tax=Lecanicillium saksenae TaxID=468837 RepID=A0ACC1QY51_9HYPO|nr:hypothetical protein NLG97_g3417 [Lecanicillium saksenae]
MDDTFGPRLLGHFDFTLLFEHSIFQIAPSAIVIFTLPFYIHRIVKFRPIVRPGWLLWTKLTAAFAIVTVQVATTVFWHKSPLNSIAAQAASIMSCVAALGILILTYASHSHFLQPVSFLAAYLNVTLLLDLTTIYTYFHRTGLGTIAWLTCSLPPLKFMLLILEEISKRSLIIAENRDELSREVFAGFWSRSTFLWVNPLLLFGFSNSINNNDLPDIGHQFDSKELYENLQICWAKQDKRAKNALLWALPDYVSKEEETTALILATALVFSGKAVSRAWFSHIRNQIMVSIRGALVSAIYQKSLRLGASESEESSAVALMTTDVPGVGDLISLSYDSFAMLLEFTFGITVLSLFVGLASIFTVITAFIVTIFVKYIAKRMANNRTRWNEHISDRIAATSNILAQIKDIKMSGLAPSMGKFLMELRAKEVDVCFEVKRIICFIYGMMSVIDTVTPSIVVAATLFWTKSSESISTARFYAILAVIAMIVQPLANSFWNLSNWATGFACLARIQAYLAQDDLEDPRQVVRSLGVRLASNTNGPRRRRSSSSTRFIPYAIQLTGVNVSMDLTGSILRDASIVIKAGEITVIHGSVGCGKSTLLKVMLGEMLLRNGLALIASRSIAFAGQKPWLLNTSVRLNIIGHKPYDAVVYERVTFICDLIVDFQRLPNGDETLVGSDGCMLSGGQKLRISIARALYLEADVTILDDPFSSLDLETATVIRLRLIADGRATAGGRTLVMTTSMKQHLVDANNTFRVTTDGHVIALTREEVNTELTDLARNRQSGTALPVASRSIPAEPFEPPAVEPATDDDTNDRPSTDEVYGSFSLYVYLLRPAGILLVSFWIFVTAITALSERLPSKLFRFALCLSCANKDTKDIYIRIWLDTDAHDYSYFIGYALLCLLNPICNCLSAMFFYYFINSKSANKLHENLADATFGATFEFLTTEDTSSILNRFSTDMSQASQSAPALLPATLFRTFSVIIDIGIISAGASYAAPVIPCFLGIILLVRQYYLHTSLQLRVLELDTSKMLVRHFTETAAGIEHIRAFRWQEEVIHDCYSSLNLAQRAYYFLFCIQQWLECVLDFSSVTAAVLVVSFALKFSNTASANSMGLAFLSLIGFSDTVSEWIQSSVAMETACGAISRIRSYCDATPAEDYKRDTEPASPDWPVRGQLELNCVSAIYRAQATPQFSQMNNASVIVRPGETLGIAGRTGSGKTTVLLSILNLLQYKGTISIDNREIRTVPPDYLRSRMTIITQGGIHLRGSVKFNLDPFHHTLRPSTCIVTDQMCQDVLQRVGLWHIISSRGHLSSRMKDMNLSHGQRQLFQIARAILHHETTGSKIVLMDEATSSLDDETDDRIAAIIRSAFVGCAKVIVSHRSPTIYGSDAVMALNEGRAEVARHTPNQPNWRLEFE